jgi:hypothetical protein
VKNSAIHVTEKIVEEKIKSASQHMLFKKSKLENGGERKRRTEGYDGNGKARGRATRNHRSPATAEPAEGAHRGPPAPERGQGCGKSKFGKKERMKEKKHVKEEPLNAGRMKIWKY